MTRGLAQIVCELAKSQSEHQRGLMFRERLDPDNGMLFHFGKPKPISFWGMNTLIPLDIAFISHDGIIENIGLIKPHCLDSVKSSKPCLFALEVPEGTLRRHGIKAGDFAEVIDHSHGAKVILVRKIDNGPIKIATSDMQPNGEFSIENEESPARSSVHNMPSDPAVPNFNNVFDALNWCIQNKQVCRISYRTGSGRVITRDIEPHDIFDPENKSHSIEKHHKILSTWDENANGPRSYIIMRIISYTIPGRKFVPKIQLY